MYNGRTLGLRNSSLTSFYKTMMESSLAGFMQLMLDVEKYQRVSIELRILNKALNLEGGDLRCSSGSVTDLATYLNPQVSSHPQSYKIS